MAVALLATTFLAVSQLFSGSLRLAGLNGHYSEATAFADRKMDEILQSTETPEENGYTDSGNYKGLFKWDLTVTPYEGLETQDDLEFPLELFNIRLDVTWGEGERQRLIRLDTVKTYSRTESG